MAHAKKDGDTFDAGDQNSQNADAGAGFFLKKQRVALARGQTTRLVNQAKNTCQTNLDSLEFLKMCVRVRDKLYLALETLTTAFDALAASVEVQDDDEFLTSEFDKHLRYDSEANDAIEALQVRIDALEAVHGAFSTNPNASSTPCPQNGDHQVYEEIPQGEPHSEQPLTEEPLQEEPHTEETQQNNTQADESSRASHVIKVKDPASKVPKFNGDPVKFEEFWDLFKFYVDQQPLETFEKCRILKNALVGKALSPVFHLKISKDTYEIMKQTIVESFGDNDMASAALIQKVNSLCFSKELQKPGKFVYFVNQLAQSVRYLVALGNSFESLSVTFTPLILGCIPDEHRLEFNKQWLNRSDGVTCALESLINFLEKTKMLVELSERQRSFSSGRNREGNSPGGSGGKGGKPSGSKDGSEGKRGQSGSGKPQKEFGHDQKSQFSFAGLQPPEDSCIFCSEGHNSVRCPKPLTAEERRKRCLEEEACLRCLRRRHRANKCRAKVADCEKCSGKHSTLVCTRKSDKPPEEGESRLGAAGCHFRTQSAMVQTGFVWVINGNRKRICRVLLDPGSMISLVSRSIVEELGIPSIGSERTEIHGIAGQVSESRQLDVCRLTIKSRFSPKQITINCLSVRKIIQGILPASPLLSGFSPAADAREEGFPEGIDLLIGNDWLHRVYSGSFRRVGSAFASPTHFGWFFWGKQSSNLGANSVHTSSGSFQLGATCSVVRGKQQSKPKVVIEGLERLWETEVLGIERSLPDEEEQSAAEMTQWFESTIKRAADGRYIVSLPFKDNKSDLGDNQKLALSRLMSFLKNAKKKPDLLRAVDEEIKKYIAAGYAELAETRKEGEQAYFLPLLAVAKKSLSESQELKVRVVKDGGSRSRDQYALNDVLEKGPNLLPEILSVLIQFRRKPIVIVADIVRAFMQFLISKEDRKYLRFFWPTGIADNPSAPIKQYWATVLDFGLICSPWLHCAGVRHHLNSLIESRPRDAQLLSSIRDSIYMDDFNVGLDSVPEAKRAIRTIIEVFNDGKFPLDKWATNCEQLVDFIKASSGSAECSVSATDKKRKFLGVPWDQTSDELFIEVHDVVAFLSSGRPTKRQLLKGLSKIFDPLGILSSLSINFKILTQVLWSEGLDWDAPLPAELEEEYRKATALFKQGELIRISRKLFSFPRSEAVRELHVFADSSLRAYGSVCYIREIRRCGSRKEAVVRFVMAKARVAPLKGRWTIPRLELVAATVAARLASNIQRYLGDELDSVFLYSDNASVLHWVRDDPDRWKTFVAHRVREIQSLTNRDSWRFVCSGDNPADLLSRGVPLNTGELRDFWLRGPRWLAELKKPAPHSLNGDSLPEEVLVERKAVVLASAVVGNPTPQLFRKQFSSWPKAVRVLAYMLRFVSSKSKDRPKDHIVDSTEYQLAENKLLKVIQWEHFGGEVVSKCADVGKGSELYQLSPFVAEDGFLRCRSRLEKSKDLDYDQKFPIILPGGDFLTQLLIRWVHASPCLHSGGVAGVLHELRRRFFVIRARRAAKTAISGCKRCVRFRAVQASLPIPPLPDFRVETCVPFAAVGADHAGPIYYRNVLGEKQKSYILLLVCAVTRAVRIELVADLSTYEFLLALRRFLARNPGVKRIVSDNAKTFKKAKDELDIIFQHAKSADVRNWLAQKRIEWVYSPPKSPQAGGFWERLVQVVKRPLRKILGVHCLKFRELETVLSEIECVVNNRPISAVIADPSEPRAFSPADLLYGHRSQPSLPETKKILKDADCASAIVFSERWKAQQSVLRAFWKHFQNDYLQYLRSAHYAKPQSNRPLAVGDVCILHSADASRAFWPLCVVRELVGGRRTDQLPRTCVIQTNTGQVLRRPIHLLYRLEVSQF